MCSSRAVFLLLRLLLLCTFVRAFNVDVHAPIFKIGPPKTYFGFSVAEHFNGERPVVLVGAPRAESGQPGTEQAGAVFSCPVTTGYTNRSKDWCHQEVVEYENAEEMRRPVGMVHGKQLHYQGKNRQLLGSLVASSGIPNGTAMACAPLVRYHNTSAYTDGTCFVLGTDLSQKEVLLSCMQGGLPRSERHNEFGSCMEGFSGYVDESMVITGLPGAKKWTGGVFARYHPPDIFSMTVDRWTMGGDPRQHGVRSKLQGHDYLGYSVTHGRFGFWFEDEKNSTIVSGATRYNQSGAVVFLPFRRGYAPGSTSSNQLTLTDDSFMIVGTQLGSAFGYCVAAMDLNSDGMDDLLIGAPFEYIENAEGSFGGAVYIFFSSGRKRARGENSKVFLEPVKVRGRGIYSQFGISITRLGDIDGDSKKFNDFAVGSPYADEGKGAVYIYQGAESPKDFKLEPIQVISAAVLSKVFPGKEPLSTFGFSLSGGVDLDNNGYNDLVVGSFASDAVTILRSRPVINVNTRHLETDLKVDIDGVRSCASNAKTCFVITTELSIDSRNSKSAQLLDFDRDVFKCTLEVIAANSGIGTRAKIVATGSEKYSWDCGRNTNVRSQKKRHVLFIPDQNMDWINPLKMRFSVRILNESSPEMPREGDAIVNLNKFPVLNKFGSVHTFAVPFNKKCGADNICTCDLQLQSALSGISQKEDGSYVTQVGEKTAIDISFVVKNKGERAYEAMLFVEYNSAELDVPVLSKKDGAVNIQSSTDNFAIITLGNPMEPEAQLNFELSFKLARGRTAGLGKQLEFYAFVNSTSEENNISDNSWEASVRIIKRAELELSAVSFPKTVQFGGDVKGESAMEFDVDIGPLVIHKYTITNKGPWSVSNVLVTVEWPHQVESVFAKGKWALYLMEPPTIEIRNTDNKKITKKCSMALPTEWVNPLQLKFFVDLKLSTLFETDGSLQESAAKVNRLKRSSNVKPEARPSRELRIKTTKVREQSGEEVEIVRVSCAEGSAKCFTVKCNVDFLDVDESALLEFRSRLWNATFVEDYYDVTYVEISSSGKLHLDPEQGIVEKDESNNYASAVTNAYPDRPAIQEMAPIPWWLIVAAVIGGLLILLILIFILWKCGFFKRNRPNQPTLHQAEFQFRQEQWSES